MENNIRFKDVSILVVGFDGYKDVWNHFFTLINKYWPDRPKTYLATSELCPKYENVITIPAGSNSEWSKRAYNALQQIDSKYVILLLEDFFITDYVDNKKVEEAIDIIENNNILFYENIVKRHNFQKINGKPYSQYKHIRKVPSDRTYSINLQPAIWDKDFLIKTIGPENYNAWIFEINNMHRKDINISEVQYLMDTRNIFNITHTIVQSKYLRRAIKKMHKIGYDINQTERPVLNFTDNLKYNFKCFMAIYTPKFLVKSFKRVGKIIGFDFVTDRNKK